MSKPRKTKAPTDPALPEDALAAIERCWAIERASGVLVGGLGGPPVFAGQVRRALGARFGLKGELLDQADALVGRRIREDLRPMPRDPSGGWVGRWQTPRNLVF